jgi:hypothetical protein
LDYVAGEGVNPQVPLPLWYSLAQDLNICRIRLLRRMDVAGEHAKGYSQWFLRHNYGYLIMPAFEGVINRTFCGFCGGSRARTAISAVAQDPRAGMLSQPALSQIHIMRR